MKKCCFANLTNNNTAVNVHDKICPSNKLVVFANNFSYKVPLKAN